MDDDDEFMNFAEEQVSNRLEKVKPTLLEIEQRTADRKAAIQAAKDKLQWDMASMASDAMDTMRMGLQSEDEGIRMKALSMYLDRMAPRVGVVREQEVIEVEDVGKKMTLEEIEAVLKKKGMIDESGSN